MVVVNDYKRFTARRVDRDVLPVYQGAARLVALSTSFCAPYVFARDLELAKRVAAGVALCGIAGAGAYWTRRPGGLAALQHEQPVLVASAALVTSAAGVALTGGHTSPFHVFTTFCATPLGASVLGRRSAWWYGLLTGSLVVATQLRSAKPGRVTPWRTVGGYLGTPPLLAGPAHAGALLAARLD